MNNILLSTCRLCVPPFEVANTEDIKKTQEDQKNVFEHSCLDLTQKIYKDNYSNLHNDQEKFNAFLKKVQECSNNTSNEKELAQAIIEKIFQKIFDERDSYEIRSIVPLIEKCAPFCTHDLILKTAKSCVYQAEHALDGRDPDDYNYYQFKNSRINWLENAFKIAQAIGEGEKFAPDIISYYVNYGYNAHQVLEYVPFCKQKFLLQQANDCIEEAKRGRWDKKKKEKENYYNMAFNLIQKTDKAQEFASIIINGCIFIPFGYSIDERDDANQNLDMALKYVVEYGNSEQKMKVFDSIIYRSGRKIVSFDIEYLSKLIFLDPEVNKSYEFVKSMIPVEQQLQLESVAKATVKA